MTVLAVSTEGTPHRRFPVPSVNNDRLAEPPVIFRLLTLPKFAEVDTAIDFVVTALFTDKLLETVLEVTETFLNVNDWSTSIDVGSTLVNVI